MNVEIDSKILHNLAESKNPYNELPCNYISYGDYCNPETCWCNKKMRWDMKNQNTVTNVQEKGDNIKSKEI